MTDRSMQVLICAVALGATLFAPSALADGGPSPGVMQGWDGVLAPRGQVRYVAVPGGRGTAVLRVRARGGRILGYNWLQGQWGIPQVTFGSAAVGGISADGRTLVLGSVNQGMTTLRKKSGFAVFDAQRLRMRRVVWLRGDFSFDALSPRGETLFLIEHISARDITRYIVRAYDLTAWHLRRGIVADRSSWESTMSGSPVARVSSRDGRWVYTLYATAGKTKAFVHALDTQRAQAVCIDLPLRGSDNGVWNLRMNLRSSRRELVLRERGGRRRMFVIDVRTRHTIALRR